MLTRARTIWSRALLIKGFGLSDAWHVYRYSVCWKIIGAYVPEQKSQYSGQRSQLEALLDIKLLLLFQQFLVS
jgi:hypothetical protein